MKLRNERRVSRITCAEKACSNSRNFLQKQVFHFILAIKVLRIICAVKMASMTRRSDRLSITQIVVAILNSQPLVSSHQRARAR